MDFTSFAGARFRGRTSFSRATFQSSELIFEDADFGGLRTSFHRATFAILANFRNATFHAKETDFTESRFTVAPDDVGAVFTGCSGRFEGASFNESSIDVASRHLEPEYPLKIWQTVRRRLQVALDRSTRIP
jgi:uncharacterized protein YjbI with pentapeptide repeats